MILLKKNAANKVVIAVAALLIAGSLASFLICIGINESSYLDGVIYVQSWLACVFCLVVLISLFFSLRKKDKRIVWFAISIITIFIYVLSLRVIVFSAMTGDIKEYWSGFLIRENKLSKMENQGYCYEIEMLSFKIISMRDKESISYFRGVWPSMISENDLRKKITIFDDCNLNR